MSLQSYITEEGAEIGIAQSIQAFAAGITPTLHINPILLKPEGEQGIQVIVHGRLYKTLSSEELIKEKPKLWEAVDYSIKHLSQRFDLIIIEGSGSPAEINLIDQDIANMKVAKHLNAPVILVGDIDKGGVFASIYGTVKLLADYEYDCYIKGFIINKFRGKVDVLYSGIKKLENLLNKPCLGVIPYLTEPGIADEDGVSAFLKNENSFSVNKDVRIVVLRLRHISNFSDFYPLKFEPDVELIFSLRYEDILTADIIIIPGTKKTVDDLILLKELKLDKLLKEMAKRGNVEIVGICGGFQMLGERLFDPYNVEGNHKEIEGLSLLPIETVFYPEKITSQVEGFLISNPSIKVSGYEIHKGITFGEMNLFKIKRKHTEEWLTEGLINGNVWGTYLHGVFENDSLRRWLINKHRIKKSLTPIDFTFSWNNLFDSHIKKLSEIIEANIDIERLWQIAGL